MPLPDLLDDNKVWARLKGGETASCIFLDETTNQCQIYHARPAQCRTYPFWPNILQTPELWNAECRRAGGDDSDETIVDGGISSLLPFWSAEEGGCEGMKLLPSKDEKAVATTDTTDPVEDAVPIREACSQLMDYVLADSRFPQSAEEIPIEAIGESSGNHNE
uniref:Zinc/iron-chelating domain-containing protein n=1 Tax=Entomoneis paludosa TaxID=265537 RepID=A0A7S3DS65_9STRA